MSWIKLLLQVLKVIPYFLTWFITNIYMKRKEENNAAKTKTKQLQAATNRPRTRADLDERLRKGKF